MSELKSSSLVKPTVDTPFHIDFSWWRENDREWHVYLRGLMGEEHADKLDNLDENQQLDWVDPTTAEVLRVDALQYLLISHFSGDESLLEEGTTIVEAVFRSFLFNGNTPQSATELAERLDRPANTILRTLAGPRVYRGLRPVASKS